MGVQGRPAGSWGRVWSEELVNEQLGDTSPCAHLCGVAVTTSKVPVSSAPAQCYHVRGSQMVLLMRLFKRVKCFAHVRCCH